MLASSSSQAVNQVQFNSIRRPVQQCATPHGRSDFCLFPFTSPFNLDVALVLLEMFEKIIFLKRIFVVCLERVLFINCSYNTSRP
jgi:hypothetical protein